MVSNQNTQQKHAAAVAAILFALKADDGLEFVHAWNYGQFDKIRNDWPEAPEYVYIGADPKHPETIGYERK